jgi:hypothetical protein
MLPTELGACGYDRGSEGKLTNATSPFLPRILIVRLVDGDTSGLSSEALALATAGGGVGRPADAGQSGRLPALCCVLTDSATGRAVAMFVASGTSGTTGLYGTLRNAGTKKALGVFTSDGVYGLLILSLR